MQAAPRDDRPISVLFDSSLDGGIDQVLAFAMLFHIDRNYPAPWETGSARIASLSTSSFNLNKAAFMDAIARFYKGGVTSYSDGVIEYGPRRGMLPIGMSEVGTQTDTVAPMISETLARVDEDGEPIYPHTVSRIADTAEAPVLMRNALSAQQDENAAVVLAGLPTNLLALLDLPGAADWVVRKARVLSVAGGRFDGGSADSGVRADVAGFRKLLAEWPTPVVMAGTELNEALPLPSDLLLTDSAADDPVADAVRAYRPLPYDAPTQALAATLYALGLDEDYFELSEPGNIAILDDGRTEFTPSAGGRHHYLTVPENQRERVLQTYVQFLTPEEEGP